MANNGGHSSFSIIGPSVVSFLLCFVLILNSQVLSVSAGVSEPGIHQDEDHANVTQAQQPTVALGKAAAVTPEPTAPANQSQSTGAPVMATTKMPIATSRPLLGVNGTGQRIYNLTDVPNVRPTVVSDPMNATNGGAGANLGAVAPKVVSSTTAVPPPKWDSPSTSNWNDDFVNIDQVDKDGGNISNETFVHNNITTVKEEYHTFYNSTLIQDTERVVNYYKSFENLKASQVLSKSHRRAMTIQLQFDFPFYGNPIRNITIATGGFIYTGDYVHSWLAATQFIAPLMANFDTSLSNDSFVKYLDNGTSFTVLWDNVHLQDLALKGPFSFSATLHQNGEIVFGYYSIPMSIDAITDTTHPVKVGLSDAYISDKTVYYTRRKTIYEYHRVTFADLTIKNNTLIVLTPEPTCISMTDCVSCVQLTSFKCGWCPTLNRCSTGTDRKRNEWMQTGCDQSQVAHENECIALKSIPFKNISKVGPPKTSPIKTSDDNHQETEKSSGVGTALGVLIPLFVIVGALSFVTYAYRNPHTKSGQFLIQYRPSQWWRRGEARYTAATIHM